MLKRLICSVFSACKKTVRFSYDSVMFQSHTPSLPDEPRCSIYKNVKKAA